MKNENRAPQFKVCSRTDAFGKQKDKRVETNIIEIMCTILLVKCAKTCGKDKTTVSYFKCFISRYLYNHIQEIQMCQKNKYYEY